jgi:integrase/recombinase XerD
MRSPPDEDQDNVNRFLKAMRFRQCSAVTSHRVRGILRSFLKFVRVRSGSMAVSEETLRAWLTERRQHWALRLVERRAKLVDQFLDWMETCGRIPSNPFKELRSQYGQHTAPIVRALLSADSQSALEDLRPLPAFASVLGPRMREHVVLMRSLGRRYETEERVFRRFDRFLQGRHDLIDESLPALIAAWQQAGTGARHALDAQHCGRILSKAQRRRDPRATMIPLDRQLSRRARAEQRRPYIYSEEEVAKLLATARSFPSPRSRLRPFTLYTMLVLAYGAGLRFAEFVNLTVGDVDLKEGTIEIRETKFFKSRRLPLTPSVVSALRIYLEERRKVGAPETAATELFWNDEKGKRYSPVTIRDLLVKVLRRSGIKPARGRIGPRIHDLRHAMVCNRMLAWYKQGINPQSRLAHLSTFMGHRDIDSTLVYLTITPELLQLASERFRQHAVHVLRSTERRS